MRFKKREEQTVGFPRCSKAFPDRELSSEDEWRSNLKAASQHAMFCPLLGSSMLKSGYYTNIQRQIICPESRS